MSAIQTGRIAWADRVAGPGEPAAGETYGDSDALLSLDAEFTDDEHYDLNEAGFNTAKMKFGGARLYGFRTLAPKDTDEKHWQANGRRTMMAIKAKGEVIAERHLFRQIDGRRVRLGSFEGDLIAEACLPFYKSGAIYGDTPQEAFNVNVGASVNTAESLQDGQLKAVISVRTSPFAEWVRIELVKKLIMEPVA